METITIPGYTYAEKLAIATNHLLPKQVRLHGLSEADVQVTEEALLKVATGYTRESGVRHLEREIGSLVRAKAVEYAEIQEKEEAGQGGAAEYQPLVTLADVEEILGQEKFVNEVTERVAVPGVVTGMAYNGVGGGILFIEVSQMPGKGSLQLTGSLGDVIKESAQIALSWVKGHGYDLGLTHGHGQNIMEKSDVHIHMPSGGTPKVTTVCGAIFNKHCGHSPNSDTPPSYRRPFSFFQSTVFVYILSYTVGTRVLNNPIRVIVLFLFG